MSKIKLSAEQEEYIIKQTLASRANFYIVHNDEGQPITVQSDGKEFYRVKIPDDGACLFHSVFTAAKNNLKLKKKLKNLKIKNANDLRKKLCEHMLDKPATEFYVNDQDYKSEWTRMKQKGAWGGGLQISALVDYLGCNIHVVHKNLPVQSFKPPEERENRKPNIYIHYTGVTDESENQVHYETLLTTKQVIDRGHCFAGPQVLQAQKVNFIKGLQNLFGKQVTEAFCDELVDGNNRAGHSKKIVINKPLSSQILSSQWQNLLATPHEEKLAKVTSFTRLLSNTINNNKTAVEDFVVTCLLNQDSIFETIWLNSMEEELEFFIRYILNNFPVEQFSIEEIFYLVKIKEELGDPVPLNTLLEWIEKSLYQYAQELKMFDEKRVNEEAAKFPEKLIYFNRLLDIHKVTSHQQSRIDKIKNFIEELKLFFSNFQQWYKKRQFFNLTRGRKAFNPKGLAHKLNNSLKSKGPNKPNNYCHNRNE